MIDVFSAFAFILAMLLVGRVLAWRALVPASAPETLNLVVLYVCLPAAVLLYTPKLTLHADIVGLVAVPWLLLLASVAIVWPLSRLLRLPRADTAALLMQVPLGNTSFLGFALIPALAGEAALRYAVVYDQFGSFLILSTYGLVVIALYGGGARPTPWSIGRRILTFPPFLALAVALTLMPSDYPAPIEHALKLLADALLPLVALAIGMQLRLALPRHHVPALAIGLVLKLLVMPALALAICAAFGLSGDMRAAALYETAMPPMITAGALLAMAGLAPELAAALVGYGIVLSMATLPLWHWLLEG